MEGKSCSIKKKWLWVLVLMFGLLFISDSYAQQKASWKRNGAPGPGNLYDPKTVETVKGEVLRVKEFTLAQGMPPGVELHLKAENKEIIQIFLGPQWYLENLDFEIEAKDRLDVKGSRITYEGRSAIVAAVVFRGEEVLRLRDEKGVPVWSSWMPRQ